jgi:hypothetical protein
MSEVVVGLSSQCGLHVDRTGGIPIYSQSTYAGVAQW